MFYLLFDTVAKHGRTSKYATQWRAAAHTAPVVIYGVFSKRAYFTGYQITLSPFYFYFPVKMFNAPPHKFGHQFKDDRRYRKPPNTSYFTHIRVVVKSDDLDILDHEL